MSSKNALSENLRSSRPFQLLEESLHRGRLAHGILLHGENLRALEEVALTLAGSLLATPRRPLIHPDLFVLRPSHRARHIRIEPTRRLIRDIQHSPLQSDCKVAVIFEADRMNNAASNAFLKTLEEPPLDTTIFLLSTRPYDLLSTIRSRCFNFRLPIGQAALQNDDWHRWLEDYRAWMDLLLQHPSTANARADIIFALYGLIVRFQTVLKEIGARSWEEQRADFPDGVSDNEKEAIASGLQKAVRHQMLCELELETADFAIRGASVRPNGLHRQLAHAVTALEHITRLLEVNLHESAALEHFLIDSLRNWTRR